MFAGQGVALPQYARDALLLGHATASAATANLERSETVEAPLLVSSIVAPTPPPAFQPTPEHMALLMVQMINTVTGMQETAALAAIETQGGDSLQQALANTQTQWEQASQSQTLQFHAA